MPASSPTAPNGPLDSTSCKGRGTRLSGCAFGVTTPAFSTRGACLVDHLIWLTRSPEFESRISMFCFSKADLLPLQALAVALLFAGLPLAHAQVQSPAKATPPPVQRADPAAPEAVIPAGTYRSSLSRYQAFTEPDVAPWPETNELVRQRGGWRAYAREAREPASPSAALPAASAASQPANVKSVAPGHAGHEMK